MSKSSKILLAILSVLVIIAAVVVVNDSNLSSNITENQLAVANQVNSDANNNNANNNEINDVENQSSEENNSSNNNNNDNNNSATITDSKTQSNELFAEFYSQAEQTLKTMSLEEKVGQLFLARYPESGVIQEIKENNPGGYILFGRDFQNKTKSSMLQELTDCQNNSKIKLALGVDEEGGTVVRVSAYKAFRSTKFLSPQQLWAKGQLPLILQDSKEKSELLKSIGLNMNLAPVVDVPTSSSAFIYARSYGRGAEKTATYTEELIKTMNESGMISTMKHFPGYGDNVDTHTGIAIDERPYTTFENSDFLPFKSGIEAGGPAILVSHNVVKCMDASKPASLSEKVHKILRDDLNFSGIIMTDDLAMEAVKSYVENGEAAVQAVLAGNDMIITSDFTKQKEEVLTAVKNGKIPENLINQAVKRILAWKYKYKII